MLLFTLNKKVNYLSRRIKRSWRSNRLEPGIDSQVSSAMLNWCPGHLFSELLSVSSLTGCFPSKKDLELFYENYPHKDGINLKELYDKLWVRDVMNRIEIPAKVSAMFHDLKRFYEKGINDKDSETYRQYCEFLNGNRCQLNFLRDFRKSFSPYREYCFKIDEALAIQIIDNHSKTFPTCPSVDYFVEREFFQISNDQIVFHFRSKEKLNYWEPLKDKISGLLWMKLLKNNPRQDVNQLLDKWLDIVLLSTQHMYPSRCMDFMEAEIKKDFIALIRNRILAEPDLQEVEQEISKVVLEESLDRPMDVFESPLYFKIKTDQTLEEKYKVIEAVQAIPNSNLFFNQRCRYRINILASIVLQSEGVAIAHRLEEAKNAFSLVIELLKAGNTRPYLLYEFASLIKHFRPEIIPYLLVHKDLEYIGLKLLESVEISDAVLDKYEEDQQNGDDIYQVKTSLWLQAIDILLTHFVLHCAAEERQKVSLTVDILSKLAAATFKKPNNPGRLPSEKALSDRYRLTWQTLFKFKEGPLGETQYGREKQSWIARGFGILTEKICALEISPYHADLFIPSLWLLDMHISLLNLLKHPLLFNDITLEPEVVNKVKSCCSDLKENLHKLYLSFYTTTDMKVVDYRNGILTKNAKFYLSTYGVGKVDWRSYVNALSETQFYEFLYAFKDGFDLAGCDERFVLHHENVRQLREKYYYHLKVLNTAYAQLKETYGSEEILSGLEKRITEITCNFSQTIVADNRVDIFDKDSEMFSEKGLFEEVMETVNSFTPKNRAKIIEVLAGNLNELSRIFLAFNILSSEGDRKYLLKKIEADKLDRYLQGQSWLPNVQQILLHSINSQELTDFAEQIFRFVEPKIIAKDSQDFETQHLYFRIKLLLAYRRKDKMSIQTIEAPSNPSSSYYSGFYYEEQPLRKLYLAALLQEEGQHRLAYKEFALLHITHPKNIQIASNKFNSAIELAKSIESLIEREQQLLKALEEWVVFEKELTDEEKQGSDSEFVQLCKLECLYLLKRFDQIDALIPQIKKPTRYSLPFAEFIFKSNVQQHRYKEAIEFVNELERFHQDRSNELPGFINQFRREIGDEDHIKRLKFAYGSMLNQTSENLIRALPSAITERGNNLGDFLLDELLQAAQNVQSKIVTTEIKEENKLTDFLQMLVNARLSAWRMQWNSQERQGKAQSNKGNPAEVDLSIRMQHCSFPLEAVRFNTSFGAFKGNLEKHILKNFDQTSTRKYLFNVVYYQHTRFIQDWREFCETFLPNVNFKKDFQLQSAPQELNWSTTTPNLKACKTTHENNVTCYYLFIDLTLFN